jgi:hypothetical protein
LFTLGFLSYLTICVIFIIHILSLTIWLQIWHLHWETAGQSWPNLFFVFHKFSWRVFTSRTLYNNICIHVSINNIRSHRLFVNPLNHKMCMWKRNILQWISFTLNTCSQLQPFKHPILSSRDAYYSSYLRIVVLLSRSISRVECTDFLVSLKFPLVF